MGKRKCSECGWTGPEEDVLTAPNPFAEDVETMLGCPDCREPNTMRVVCDEPGCWHEASCGTPSPKGYRQVCGDHFRVLTASR